MTIGPLVRAEDRLPRVEWPPSELDCAPSATRPLALRLARRAVAAPTARHRTNPYRTAHTQQTSDDSKTKTDTWYTPDD